MSFAYGSSELLNLDSARSIGVNLVELSSQLSEFLRIDHLAQDLKALSSEPILSMELR